jgi:hypothetical protein
MSGEYMARLVGSPSESPMESSTEKVRQLLYGTTRRLALRLTHGIEHGESKIGSILFIILATLYLQDWQYDGRLCTYSQFKLKSSYSQFKLKRYRWVLHSKLSKSIQKIIEKSSGQGQADVWTEISAAGAAHASSSGRRTGWRLDVPIGKKESWWCQY